MSKGEAPSRTERVTGYFRRRIGNPFINRVGRDALTGSAAEARSVLRAEKISRDEVRSAMNGRYADGGRERFQDLMRERGLSERDLAPLERMRSNQFLWMCLISLVTLLLGASIPFMTDDPLITVSGLIFGLFSLVFIMIGLRHDFSAWQIRNRRFGGVREYVSERWGG